MSFFHFHDVYPIRWRNTCFKGKTSETLEMFQLLLSIYTRWLISLALFCLKIFLTLTVPSFIGRIYSPPNGKNLLSSERICRSSHVKIQSSRDRTPVSLVVTGNSCSLDHEPILIVHMSAWPCKRGGAVA